MIEHRDEPVQMKLAEPDSLPTAIFQNTADRWLDGSSLSLVNPPILLEKLPEVAAVAMTNTTRRLPATMLAG